jgi:two-component system OmpR family sensor kinase/two-component system sensor histidine kinase BaeS
MRRLRAQLALAFTLVALLSVAVAALLANRQTSADFRSYLAHSEVQQSGLLAELESYYQTHGGWDGVAQVFAARPGLGGGGGGRGMMRGAPALTLIDAAGAVRYDNAGAAGTPIGADELARAIPIVIRGAEVGRLVVRAGGQVGLGAAAERFLAQINLALVQAGVVGALLGALLGLLLARGLAAPLDRLAAAAHGLAAGDLTRRVAVAGPAEVADAASAFNEMADALERGEALRRRMVADIAHELRTPLTVVQGNLQAILDGVYPLERSEVQTVYDETLLLGRLVDDLRELALAEAGQLQIAPEVLDVADLVERELAAFRPLAAAKGVALAAQAHGALPAAWADPRRAGQVLHNLVANALHHTPAGGAVTLETTRRADAIEIAVRDTGEGIAAEYVPHVFERFWRADAGRARAQGGSGLGLAIARQLVQAQGGAIGVTSEVGQGSRFWFTLPPAAPEDAPAVSAPRCA